MSDTAAATSVCGKQAAEKDDVLPRKRGVAMPTVDRGKMYAKYERSSSHAGFHTQTRRPGSRFVVGQFLERTAVVSVEIKVRNKSVSFGRSSTCTDKKTAVTAVTSPVCCGFYREAVQTGK